MRQITLQVAEAFAGNPDLDVKAYSLTQEVTLPAGDYRMTGYAFFRQGATYDVAPTKSLAQMFAGDDAVTVPTLGSIEVEGSYANSMSMAATEFYDNNHYLNTLDFSLDAETSLTLGYKGTFDLTQSWFICGETRLYRMTVADYMPEYREAYEALQAATGLTGGLQSVADQTLERYAQVNEVYTSALYPFGAVFGAVSLVGSPAGYLSINRLEDENTAAPVLQIPGVGSRDAGVSEMITDDDGVEYMTLNGSIYQDTGSFVPIYSGARSICTIQSSGYARWYDVGEAAGKTMTVTVPEGGGFCVYDGSLQTVAASWAYGTTTVELPEEGMIVFAGEIGTVFRIAMT